MGRDDGEPWVAPLGQRSNLYVHLCDVCVALKGLSAPGIGPGAVTSHSFRIPEIGPGDLNLHSFRITSEDGTAEDPTYPFIKQELEDWTSKLLSWDRGQTHILPHANPRFLDP